MLYDVFISCSSKDKAVADAICSEIENNNIKCWIAPRDILGGKEYGEAIINAIMNSKIFLVVFSANANNSAHVKIEVERAIHNRKTILTFRIENVLPVGSMEYALSSTHWIDAVVPPIGEHIITLVNTVKQHLNIPMEESKPLPIPGPPEKTTPEQYAPIVGALIKESNGEETMLTEFGIGFDNLESCVRDVFNIEKGKGRMSIPWRTIESVNIHSHDDIEITYRNDKSLNHVKPCFGRIVGTDESGFTFAFDFSNLQSLKILRDTSVPEREALLRDIPILAKKRIPNAAYTCEFTFRSNGNNLSVTLDVYFEGRLNGTQTFQMPGPNIFWEENGIVGVKADKYFNLGPFDRQTALDLAFALNRLNALLQEGKKD